MYVRAMHHAPQTCANRSVFTQHVLYLSSCWHAWSLVSLLVSLSLGNLRATKFHSGESQQADAILRISPPLPHNFLSCSLAAV